MSFVLVLVAAVFLVIGLLQSGLTLIYVSIGASVLAGAMLFVAVLRRRPREEKVKVDARPAPPTAITPVTPSPKVEPSPAPSTSTWGQPMPEVASEEPTMAVPVQVDEADDFPIAGYDELRVSEIISRLPDLDADELTAVRAREVAGRSRSAVLNRIDDQLASAPAESAWEVSESDWDAGAEGDDFPIPDYDDLPVARILDVLGDLDDDELNEVAEREEDGEGRAAILDRIDELLGDEDVPIEEPLSRAPARKAVARKAPARKTAAKKASARKAPVKKAAPARKAVARKAPAKAPVKKAVAKKAVAKKAVAKKAPAKKATAKKAPARKAPARKAGG